MKALRTGTSLSVLYVAAILLGCQAVEAEVTTVRLGRAAARGPSARRPVAPIPTGYVVEAPGEVKIDGVLDDAAWAKAQLLTVGTMTGRGRPSAAAEVRVLHKDRQIIIGMRMTEPKINKLVRKVTQRDGPAYADDSVEIFLLPSGSTYYQFGIGAGGALYDSKGRNRKWNSGAKHAVHIGKGEWSVELVVPFLDLGVGKGRLRAWRANFYRTRYAGGGAENCAWSPPMRNDYDVPARFGRLVFGNPPRKPKVVKKVEEKRPAQVLSTASGKSVVRFDLSGLAKGVKIVRAELLLFRSVKVNGLMDEAATNLEIYALAGEFKPGGEAKRSGKPLEIAGPWYDRLDATRAVRGRVGRANVDFLFRVAPLIDTATACLDITYEGVPTAVPPQVTAVKAVHRAGQTFITWREIEDLVQADTATWGALKGTLDSLDAKRRVRYCVYRSDRPITAKSLAGAELIARVKPLSCWNINGRNIDRPVDMYIANAKGLVTGHGNPFGRASLDGKWGLDCTIDRLVIEDGAAALPCATGLYVHTPGKKGKVWYAVVTCIDGVQNTRDMAQANTASVSEEAGIGEPRSSSRGGLLQGEPVLQRTMPKAKFYNYRQKRLHYVRWLAPPYTHLPSQYYNWSVGVPDAAGKSPSLELNLHQNGHSYWRTNYRVDPDGIVLAPHDFPVASWWYGYHESLGTLKSFKQGVIQPFTERRMLAFIEWAAKKWPVDRNRILVTGCTIGASGSGALHIGLRHPKVFNMVLAGHPATDYARVARPAHRYWKRVAKTCEPIWGKLEWKMKTDTGQNVWDELNLITMIRERPTTLDLPLVTMTSDSQFTNVNAREFFAVMLERRAPFIASFTWAGARLVPVSMNATYPTALRLDVRKNKSMLAFSAPAELSIIKKGKMGTANIALRWSDVVDVAGRYEVTVSNRGRKQITADVAVYRLQKFRVDKGKSYAWRLTSADGKTEHQKGESLVGNDGLLVLKGVNLTVGSRRLIVTAQAEEVAQ
jgi:cellulose/xylan binding protein with CBM9 domain